MVARWWQRGGSRVVVAGSCTSSKFTEGARVLGERQSFTLRTRKLGDTRCGVARDIYVIFIIGTGACSVITETLSDRF